MLRVRQGIFIWEKKKFQSRGIVSITRRFGKYRRSRRRGRGVSRGNWKKPCRAPKQNARDAILLWGRPRSAVPRIVYTRSLYVLKNAAVKERLLRRNGQRSDLFYWDVGTSDQFTKCPVEHGGPVIVSMIRTSFRAPIRHARTLWQLFRYFLEPREGTEPGPPLSRHRHLR